MGLQLPLFEQQADAESGEVAQVESLPLRPRTRGDCVDGPRPCPWVGCRYNLYLDVRRAHPVKRRRYPPEVRLSHPDREPWEVPPDQSCALDVADSGRQGTREVGRLLGISNSRSDQLTAIAQHKIRSNLRGREFAELHDYFDDQGMFSEPEGDEE